MPSPMTVFNMDTSYLSFPNIGLDLPLYGIVIVAITSAFAIQALYRLYFHPLAKIPGPKLTAISSLYEFYYDVICGGRFLFQIEKMHEQYGASKHRIQSSPNRSTN